MHQNISLKYPDLVCIRKQLKGKRIVFCSGGFDLTHPGHVLFFEDCRKHGDVIVVGIGGDRVRREEKGEGRPIFNQHMRLRMVSALKPVDYAFVIRDVESSGHHLEPIREILEELRPDVYAINDDAFDVPYRRAVTSGLGIELVILKRWCPPEFEQISTTKLIQKIQRLDKA